MQYITVPGWGSTQYITAQYITAPCPYILTEALPLRYPSVRNLVLLCFGEVGTVAVKIGWKNLFTLAQLSTVYTRFSVGLFIMNC